MLKGIEHVVFDFDGTLIDSDAMMRDVWRTVFSVQGLQSIVSDEFMKYQAGRGTIEAIKGYLEEKGSVIIPTIDEISKIRIHKRDLLIDGRYGSVEMIAGAADILSALKVSMRKVGICTSANSLYIGHAFEGNACELANYFRLDSDRSNVMCKDRDYFESKPSPQGLNEYMIRFEIDSRDKVLYVGDAMTDMEFANNTRVRFVGFEPNESIFPVNVETIKSLKDLITLD